MSDVSDDEDGGSLNDFAESSDENLGPEYSDDESSEEGADEGDDEDDTFDESQNITTDALHTITSASSFHDVGHHQAAMPNLYSRSLSPTSTRRGLFRTEITPARKSYTVDPIAALPHPSPIHSLAASSCFTHFLTGSEDGFIRDYDFFATANNKAILTAPQRQHTSLTDLNIKPGVLRCWWENPPHWDRVEGMPDPPEGSTSAVYSMAVHSDALWGLSSSTSGALSLFSIRHDPGKVHHVFRGHKGPVSALALSSSEQGVFSAGWDGHAIHWDLNTGQIARKFPSQGAQLTAIAIRPLNYPSTPPPSIRTTSSAIPSSDSIPNPQTSASALTTNGVVNVKSEGDEDAAGDTDNDDDFGGLFDDDEPDEQTTTATDPSSTQPPPLAVTPSNPGLVPASNRGTPSSASLLLPPQMNGHVQSNGSLGLGLPGQPSPQPTQLQQAQVPTGPFTFSLLPSTQQQQQPPRPIGAGLAPTSGQPQPPTRGPPILDPATYSTFSNDILMTAGIDGQIVLWDQRMESRVGKLEGTERTPPWCVSACWSADGSQIYAGRRNGTIDVWDVRKFGPNQTSGGQPRIFKTLRNPQTSGSVVCVAAFPDGQHLVCASKDNIRLWNIGGDDGGGSSKSRASSSFKIVAGHHGGVISQLLVDPTCRYLVSASGNRGWFGESTQTVLVHAITRL